MSEPKFVAELDWECLKDIISDVRKGAVSAVTVKKGLWVAGCAIEMFGPADRPIIGEAPFEADRSLASLCDELEAVIPADGAIQDASKIDVATVIMIVQLVWKLVQSLRI